jgi:triosephosphate isomerase
MRTLIAGNWKMHGLAPQLSEIAAVASAIAANPSAADVLICPPATLIARAADAAKGRVAIGGQDCSLHAAGAFTGEVSVNMLIDAGASAVIVGHSERRRYHGETDVTVLGKAKAASDAGLLTIICIGETEAQRKDGQTLAVCDDQIAGSMPDGMKLSATAIAHEPLWAIGSGHMPTHREIIDVHAHIRRYLLARFGSAGRTVRILYGGSVKPHNAREILVLPEVNGALIGGASLHAADFEAIVRSVDKHDPA